MYKRTETFVMEFDNEEEFKSFYALATKNKACRSLMIGNAITELEEADNLLFELSEIHSFKPREFDLQDRIYSRLNLNLDE